MIVRVSVVLRRTVVGDWRFDNLSGSHLQSQVNSVCQSMTSAQVVETSVTNNSSSQNYTHPDDHTIRTTDTPGFKPFTMSIFILVLLSFYTLSVRKTWIRQPNGITLALPREKPCKRGCSHKPTSTHCGPFIYFMKYYWLKLSESGS